MWLLLTTGAGMAVTRLNTADSISFLRPLGRCASPGRMSKICPNGNRGTASGQRLPSPTQNPTDTMQTPNPPTKQPLPHHHSRFAHPSFLRRQESIPPEQPPTSLQLTPFPSLLGRAYAAPTPREIPRNPFRRHSIKTATNSINVQSIFNQKPGMPQTHPADTPCCRSDPLRW